MCIYMVYRCINIYLQWNVVTTIQYIDQAELVFPVVSFCNVNTFASRAAYDYLRNYYNTKYGVNVTTYMDLATLVANNTVPYDTDWLIYQTYDPNFNVSLRESFNINPDQMFLFCTINDKPCNSSEFLWYYNAEYGILIYNSISI